MTGQPIKHNVAGMVTLYNSERYVLQCISTYINQVDTLYAVDNSEQIDHALIDAIQLQFPTVKYICNQGNKGIAYALNVAAQTAISDQFAYLLMMDDDSETPANLVATLLNVFNSSSAVKVGIVSAQSDDSIQGEVEREVDTTITSGSLLNLKAYQAAGSFLESLFIDWVDHEYCFRLAGHGYQIIVANQIKLTHRLGIIKHKRLFGFIPVRWRSHSPMRLYYKFRNSIYVMNIYSRQLRVPFVVSVYQELLQDLARVIFLEDHKRSYLRLITQGLSDAYKKRLGKLPG